MSTLPRFPRFRFSRSALALGLLALLSGLLALRCPIDPRETYEATVRRTAGGIPHVKAHDFASLGFGTGYAMAEDILAELRACPPAPVRPPAASRWTPIKGILDRLVPQDLIVPTESSLVLREDIVMNDRIKLDPSRNDFPVTLHDPCNITRSMGIIQPQRNILKKICPQFREIEPHGVENYCCGGGSGFAVCQSMNFPDWRTRVAGRMKFRQILDALAQDVGRFLQFAVAIHLQRIQAGVLPGAAARCHVEQGAIGDVADMRAHRGQARQQLC